MEHTKDKFCKHLSSTEYKAPVVNFPQMSRIFPIVLIKVSKSLGFCHLKPAGFLSPTGCSAEHTN